MKKWYYNPFEYIAGMKAFLFGFLAFALSTFLGALNGTSFDGAFDAHLTPASLPYSYYFLVSFLSWIVPVLLFYFSGIILSQSSIRFIDILGTLGLARTPLLIMSLLGFLPVANMLKLLNPTNPNLLKELIPYIPWLLIYGMVTMACIVWVVALMLNAYKVSCNLNGPKMVISFILVLIISEIIIKVAIGYILKDIYHLPLMFKQ